MDLVCTNSYICLHFKLLLMNILHITDFHYSQKSIQASSTVVNAIIAAIKRENITIDLIIFSGDLVNDGSQYESFNDASNTLFTPLCRDLSVDRRNVVFCPGNHDIDRTMIHSAAKSFFDSNIVDVDSLNSFYANKSDSMFLDSLKPLKNYKHFLSTYHTTGNDDVIEDLYSIHYRTVDNNTIAIACLNTSWVSALDREGRNDKGNLLVPPKVLSEIVGHLKQVSNIHKKVIVLHHPLYFLKEYNFYELENQLYNEFDVMFTGHVHKILSTSRHSGVSGIFEHVSKASLSLGESQGCSIISLDQIEENTIRVREVSFISDVSECHISPEVVHTIPCGEEKIKAIQFRKKIADKISIEKENANKLLLIHEDEESQDFMSLYSHPVIKSESDDALGSNQSYLLTFSEIVESEANILLLGKDKCGKTSLLKRIQIEYLLNYTKYEIVPFYLDCKEYAQKIDDTVDLIYDIRNYYSVNTEKAKSIVSNGKFVLLIDNYTPNTGAANIINDFLAEYGIRFVVCSEYNVYRTPDSYNFSDTTFDTYYFHDLRRVEIVKYTEKRLQKPEKCAKAQDKIIQLCRQLELPLNYWTISLLLLIHEKSSDAYSKNLFSILDVCIDEIFGKKRLAISHTKISFTQLKAVCANLSKFLFVEKMDNVFSATPTEIVGNINDFIAENDRISMTADEIFKFFVLCGILKQKDVSNNLYVFRLNGFFEYFLAYQMTRDKAFMADILKDERLYLAFKNQLEIYSGFKRDDADFLKCIFEKTYAQTSPAFEKYDDNKDKELLGKIHNISRLEEACRKISIEKSLSAIEKAEFEDMADELSAHSEVHPLQVFNTETMNPDVLERYLSILGRVYRNLDEIMGHKDLKQEVFDYLIDSYCDLTFFIIDEMARMAEDEASQNDYSFSEAQEMGLYKIMTTFSPLLTQVMLFDSIGHYNIENIIKTEIQKLEQNPAENQYKLYVYYFILTDIDLEGNMEYIVRALSNITIPVLKYMLLLKLNYYMAFKGGNNKNLQNKLSRHIQSAKKLLDSKLDVNSMQKQLTEQRKGADSISQKGAL